MEKVQNEAVEEFIFWAIVYASLHLLARSRISADEAENLAFYIEHVRSIKRSNATEAVKRIVEEGIVFSDYEAFYHDDGVKLSAVLQEKIYEMELEFDKLLRPEIRNRYMDWAKLVGQNVQER